MSPVSLAVRKTLSQKGDMIRQQLELAGTIINPLRIGESNASREATS
jgi:hypothetical protein